MTTRRLMTEAEGYAFLRMYDIPVPWFSLVKNPDEAAGAADKIGYPVVLKVVSPQVIHKSDAGGVATDIASEPELRAAFVRILETVPERVPGAEIEGIMVESHLKPGLELIIGGKRDPAFGPVLTFGLGGVLVELMKDVTLGVLPLSESDLIRMIHSIHSHPLISGYRNSPPLDENALISVLRNVCTLFGEHPEIQEFDLNPLILYEEGACAVDARFLVTENEVPIPEAERPPFSEDVVLCPSSIAFVGASSNPEKIGYAVLRNLLTFNGSVYPVNLKGGTIFGRTVYRSLQEIPGLVDCVVVAVPAPAVPGVIREAGRIGASLAIVLSSGFRETGEEGATLEKELVAAARRYGLRLMGPNCLGLMLPHRDLNTTFDPVTPPPGRIAFISQSGAVISAVVERSILEEVGISLVVSVGNQADLRFEDYLSFAEHDPDTKAIVLYIEEIKNGISFMKCAQRITPKKPIIAIKSGSSEKGKRAASSHTGSLAGSYEVYQAAFRQAGIIPVHAFSDAFSVAELLSSEGYPAGNRAVIITNAGGFAVLSSDYAEENGVEMIDLSESILEELNSYLPPAWSHENPVDVIGDSGIEIFAKAFDVFIKHQEDWDVAFVIAPPTSLIDPVHLADEIVRFSHHTQKMIVGCLLGGDSMRAGIRILKKAGIPNFREPSDAFRAVGASLKRVL